jgi:hypothetical protein
MYVYACMHVCMYVFIDLKCGDSFAFLTSAFVAK